MKLHAPQGSHQSWSQFVQFARVIARELVKDLPALTREAEDGAPLVLLVDGSLDEVFAFGAINQLNGAVVLQSETAGSIGDRNGSAFGRTGNLEQKLMLLRLQASCNRCIFAELEEFSEFESKLCQCDEQIVRMNDIGLHVYISYHDIYDTWSRYCDSTRSPQ